MRVAYVCADPGVPVFGRKGASVHVQAVVRVLASRGAEVHLVGARVGGAVPEGLQRVRLHRLPAVTGDDPATRERSAAASDAAVARVLDALGHVDLVYERYSLWGRTAMPWAAAHGVPGVLEVNAPLVDEQARHRVLVDAGAAESAATAAIGSASAVVCVTEAVAAWARLRTSTPQWVHCVANGVDTRRIRPVPGPVTGCDATTFTIGFVGTLKPWHGVETLIDALALLAPDPAYRLLLVGDGPQAAALAGRAARLSVADRVEATGSVDPARMPEMLRRMDVATAPYPAIDGFYFSPLKVYEYLAAGVPVVASRVGTLPELLRDGELGELVRPGDAAELARAVEALRRDPARRARLRGAGAEAARAHDWSRVVDRCLEPVGLRLPGAGRAVA